MSGHSPIREDKTCLNCRHVVEKRYCPNCGQENTDSRKTFHHLFVHFFEDLTHYENAFWKTIKHLLFKPGRLTKEYLSGKRLSYLAPVRLYIFISFVTFLVIGFVSHSEEQEEMKDKVKKEVEDTQAAKNAEKTKIKINIPLPIGQSDKERDTAKNPEGRLARVNGELRFVPEDSAIALQTADSTETRATMSHEKPKDEKDNARDVEGFGVFKSVRELDSMQKAAPEDKKLNWFRYRVEKVIAAVQEHSDEDNYMSNLGEAVIHNIPKALFLYMPLFAFWLWLFHGKKRWYYFDHGIFTLHYFSFLLLTLCALMLISTLVGLLGSDTIDDLMAFAWLFLFGWWFFYFFRSHSRFYGESKAISRLKSLALYIINMWLIGIFTLILFMYTILSMH